MGKLIFTGADNTTEQLASQVKKGELIRVRQSVYLKKEHEKDLDKILKSEWIDLVKNLAPPSAIIAYRTAAELKPYKGTLFLIADVSSQRKVEITKDFSLVIYKGDTTSSVTDFLGVFRANSSRLYLENLIKGRANSLTFERSLGQEWVEGEICKDLEKNKEDGLNQLREDAKKIAPLLGLEKEFKLLNKIISSVLNTHSEGGVLISPFAISMAKKEPYDQNRINCFVKLKDYLEKLDLPYQNYKYSSRSWSNFAFFESYFSNYIEGTEFEISEAAKIVFQHTEINGRHEDSHDIRSVYELANDYQDMTITPETADEFFEILQRRHYLIMKERPDKNPGKFKLRLNKAGNTVFVEPKALQGTLTQGFEIYKTLSPGFNRAVFMQFLVAECHPFDDGNGRVSRLMMNAELASAGLQKIIVPNVHRDSYLNGLKSATKNNIFRTLVKVLHQLHCYSASIDWNDYDEVRDKLEFDNAFASPDEGVPVFNEALRMFKYNYPLD